VIPAWVAPAAVVAAALVSAAALIIVRRVRGPVTIQDLWAENRQLRKDLDVVSGKVDTLIEDRDEKHRVNRIIGEGFDALDNAVERAGVALRFTRLEEQALDRARALRADDSVWNTAAGPPST